MALYTYQAFSKDGKKVTGTIDAPTLQLAKEQLSKQGIYPIAVVLSSRASRIALVETIFCQKDND